MQRALTELTIGAARAGREQERRIRDMSAAELDLQFQYEISGTAENGWGFVSLTVNFDVSFYYAPGQRDNDLEHPHMTFGAEADVPVGVTAVVTSWLEDVDNGAILGCTVAVGVISDSHRPFTGKVNLNFQGYGMTPTESAADVAVE